MLNSDWSIFLKIIKESLEKNLKKGLEINIDGLLGKWSSIFINYLMKTNIKNWLINNETNNLLTEYKKILKEHFQIIFYFNSLKFKIMA